jgi:hypothetical protein
MTWKLRAATVILLCGLTWSQNTPASLVPGKLIPRVTCRADEKQSYALYLPASFAVNRKWPIIYAFDPGGRGAVAVDVIRAAAENYGYIVVGSNNSRNGPQGGGSEAAQAMWLDTALRFPIDENRRYFAGMSGGGRVASSLALSCHTCVAGVISNASGFPAGITPAPDTKFAYFASVGDADLNYFEFLDLRALLDNFKFLYRIRIFPGGHGWAPPEVWNEALNWMDIQAMASGLLARNPARIEKTMAGDLDTARNFEANHQWLAAVREYQSVARNFAGLADTTIARNRLAELEKNEEFMKQEKQEKEDVAHQMRLTSDLLAQMQKISSVLDPAGLVDLRNNIADLKHDADHASRQREKLVLQRALGNLVIQAFESGQRRLEEKDYRTALQYFDLAAAGSHSLGWVHYQRARAYAGLSNKKQMFAELKSSLGAGFHPPSALDTPEFTSFNKDPEFQSITAEWNKSAEQ